MATPPAKAPGNRASELCTKCHKLPAMHEVRSWPRQTLCCQCNALDGTGHPAYYHPGCFAAWIRAERKRNEAAEPARKRKPKAAANSALKDAPEGHRKDAASEHVLFLRESGATQAEIAERHGMSNARVRQILSRADLLQKLRPLSRSPAAIEMLQLLASDPSA